MSTNTLETRRSTQTPQSPSLARTSTPRRVKFKVEGLSCASDAARLEHRLARQVGVIGVSVNTITDFAYIAYDPTMTSTSVLQRQIEFSGFSATQR